MVHMVQTVKYPALGTKKGHREYHDSRYPVGTPLGT